MRRIGIALWLLTYATQSWALIQIRTEVETEGQKISPSVILAEDTWAEVETDTLALRFRVSKTAPDRVAVQAEIARNDAGVTTMLGKPNITTKWDEAAEIASLEDDGSLRYRLKVVPSVLGAPPAVDTRNSR